MAVVVYKCHADVVHGDEENNADEKKHVVMCTAQCSESFR